MHKSYQSFHPCGNKLLQKRWDDSTFSEHRQRVGLLRIARWRRYCQHSSLSSPLQVYQAKPMVDTKAPKERPHVASKLKKQQVGVALFSLTVECPATATNRATLFSPTVAHEGKELRGRSRQPALVAQDATHDGSWQRWRVQAYLHAS